MSLEMQVQVAILARKDLRKDQNLTVEQQFRGEMDLSELIGRSKVTCRSTKTSSSWLEVEGLASGKIKPLR